MLRIIFISSLLFSVHFCFGQNNIIPIETESGLYELTANNKFIKVEEVHFSMYFRENMDQAVINECYYKIRIGNNKSCDITLKETADSIQINCRLLYIDQDETRIAKNKFKSTSYKNAEYTDNNKSSVMRINFYETVPVYLIIDYPLVYRNKIFFLHLKPNFISE